MTKKSLIKFFIITVFTFFVFVILFISIYLKGISVLLQNDKFIDDLTNVLYKKTKIELRIDNPILKTYITPKLDFKIHTIILSKNNKLLLSVENLDTSISFKQIFKKKIDLLKFGADDLFVDVQGLINAFKTEEQKETKKSNWSVEFFDSVLYLKKAVILYKTDKNTNLRLMARNLLVDNREKQKRFVHFDFRADVSRNNNTVVLTFKDDNKVYFENQHFYIKNCPLTINKSKVFFDFDADKKNNFELLVYGQRIFIPDIIKFLQTNIIENSLDSILCCFDTINGDFNFTFKLNNKDFQGEIKVNKFITKILSFAKIPVTINNGYIKFDTKNMTLKDFKGYHGEKKSNSLSFEGTVKNYLTNLDANIIANMLLTNDFMSKYPSKVTGIKFELTGNAPSKFMVKFVNNKIQILAAAKIAKGDDILIEGASLTPVNYDRALQADILLDNNIVKINYINYYIASVINQNTRISPVLKLEGTFDILKNKITDLGFDIPNPLPSEFFNVLIRQRLFKKGTFWGNLHYYDNKDIPYLVGNMTAKKILIPSQRLFLKEGSISTTDKLVNINAQGRYRKTKYKLTGGFQNQIIFPIVVKDMNLSIGKIDIDKMLKSMNAQVEKNQQLHDNLTSEADLQNDEGAPTFDISNIIVEKSQINISEGNYKDIQFGNVKADLTLDKNSLLILKSNKFDFAQGHSSTKVECDLKNHKYNILLGVKDINADTISTSILNLPREISGKSSGIIKLHTDDSLKLNGMMKFNIKNGQIQKIGLVEYILKAAAVFRNPIAMISPTTIFDIIHVPEGNFDKIKGELILENNAIKLLKIKSQAPQLSFYIVGCYNLENSDAILRVYTKFSNKNKGVTGFFRNISLNSLANRIPLTARNDANYYAAELEQLPDIDADEKDCQVFLTKLDGDLEHNNFISSLKKIK